MNRQGRWECLRRHRTSPPLFAGSLCLPCASASLRASPSAAEPPRISLAARIVALSPTDVSTAASADPPTVLDLLDALCAAVRDAADLRDSALNNALEASIVHLAFTCDRNFEDSGHFCAVILAHIFAALREASIEATGCSDLPRPLFSYVRLVSLMLESDSKRDQVSNGLFIASFRDAAAGDGDLCSVPLRILVDSEAEVLSAVSFLVALFETGYPEITSSISSRLDQVLLALRGATTDTNRESLLSFVHIVVCFIISDDGNATLFAKVLHVSDHRIPQNLPLATLGSSLAEALKHCSISPCLSVRSRVADIIEALCISPRVSSMFTNIFATGFIDYLFEALRHPPQDVSAMYSEAATSASALTIPILNAVASIAASHPSKLSEKWHYGLPILIRVAEQHLDSATLRAVFRVLAAALTASQIPVLDSTAVSQLLTLVLHACSKLNLAVSSLESSVNGITPSAAGSDNGGNPHLLSTATLRELQSTFQDGITVLEQFSQCYRYPPSARNLLVDCVECAGMLIPQTEKAPRLARQLVNQFLALPASEQTGDLAEKIKFAVLGVWGSAAVELFTTSQRPGRTVEEGEARTTTASLVELLHVVACALDVQLFKVSPPDDFVNAIDWFWQRLSPSIVFSRLDPEDFGQAGRLPESSDIWSSLDVQPESLSASSELVSDSFAALTGKQATAVVVRLYLSRLCRGHDEDEGAHSPYAKYMFYLSPRLAKMTMPASFTAFVDQITKAGSREHLAAALILLEQCVLRRDDCLLNRTDVVRILVVRANSETITVPKFKACALMLSRLIFMCCKHEPLLLRQVALRKDFCSAVLMSGELDFAHSWDQELFLYVLSRAHDTELRIRAWVVYSEKRRADDAWRPLDVRLADLLGSDVGAAKCLVSALNEGSHTILEMTYDLCTICPWKVPSALNQVGILAMVICVLELQQAMAVADVSVQQRWQFRAAQLIDIVTIGITYASSENMHRLLMLLVDIFSQPQLVPESHSQAHLKWRQDSTSVADSACSGNPQVPSVTPLDVSILRCLASVLNNFVILGDVSVTQSRTPAIFSYIVQSSFMQRAATILFGMSDVTDSQEFAIGAAATIFDYMLRHGYQWCSIRGELSINNICSLLHRTEEAWMTLISGEDDTSAVASVHSRVCRRTACLQLLVTWTMMLDSWHPSPALGACIGDFLLVHVTSVAAATQVLPSSAALHFLQVYMLHQTRCNSERGILLDRLATFSALVSIQLHKVSINAAAASEPELRFLATALATKNMALDDGARLISGLVSIATKDDCASKLPLIAGIYRQLSAALGASGLSLLAMLKQEMGEAITEVEDGADGMWVCDELLLGRHAIIAAPSNI
jgi:hypothetical protein